MTKDEQLNAILSGRYWEVPDKEIWATTLHELETYVLKHGFPTGRVITTENTVEGLYMLQANGRIKVYEKERGQITTDIKEFDSYQAAVRYVLQVYYAAKIRPDHRPKIILSTKL